MLSNLKQRVDELVLEPGSGGVFEVLRDGETIHSKAETGAYPEEQEILEALR